MRPRGRHAAPPNEADFGHDLVAVAFAIACREQVKESCQRLSSARKRDNYQPTDSDCLFFRTRVLVEVWRGEKVREAFCAMLPPIGLIRKTGRVGSVEWTGERSAGQNSTVANRVSRVALPAVGCKIADTVWR